MRRLLSAILLLAVAGAFGIFATGASSEIEGKKYKVELDNAFGVVDGADVKIAGVRAGKVTTIDLDPEEMRAVIGFEVTKGGFDDLRSDAVCETRPQSLIGEYFIDCQPGTAEKKLDEGATIPVERTTTTIPPDLVTNIMRRPYRERLTIIYNELGAGLAGRGADLNETIRRASPALREVNRVLAILREQRRTIRDLYDDADEVVGRLADKKQEVTRFVREARDTARVSAERTEFVRSNFRLLPRFLRELQPTLKLLGDSSERQEGALRNLDKNRFLLTRFLRSLGAFSEASRPSFRTLGDAAVEGRKAMKAALPRVKELRTAVKPLPEAADNLAITLEHLDDPAFAVEKDERAGRGKDGGYTGLEALLRYVFFQGQAINLYDENNYLLKVSAFLDNDCAAYANAERAKNPAFERCRAWLGPNQLGVTAPDPTATKPAQARKDKPEKTAGDDTPGETAPAQTAPGQSQEQPAAPGTPKVPEVPLPEELQELLDDLLPGGDSKGSLEDILPGLGTGKDDGQAAATLLDFLMAP